ncbi:MAG: N-acetylmuramic acid 6-phosphate etherase [Candidatus Velthaea sp.]
MSDGLPATEAVDAATATIDALGTLELARTLAHAHRSAVDAVTAAAPAIAAAIDAVVAALRAGGNVHYIGAGTSGRLAVLDAAELPPTFGVEPALVDAHIAGGDPALRCAVEGAEDDDVMGAADIAHVRAGDVAIGISASGGAPYVRAALAAAAQAGATTVAIVSVPDSPLAAQAQIAIVLATGAEPIAGSTRMRAGTAQKIALNTISTAAMILLGKTYRNRMIDLVATNAKLRARSERLVREIAGAEFDAPDLLARAHGRVKTAVVMARCGCDRETAETKLAAAGGRLAAVIDPS